MPKKLFQFPVKRPDTITRANVRGVLLLAEERPTAGQLASYLTGRVLTLEARHVARAASLS